MANIKNTKSGKEGILSTHISKEDWNQLTIQELKEVVTTLGLKISGGKEEVTEELSKYTFESKQAQNIIKTSEPVTIKRIEEETETWTCDRLANLVEKLGVSCSEQTIYLALLYHKAKIKGIEGILNYNEVCLSKYGSVQSKVLQSVFRKSEPLKDSGLEVEKCPG